MSVLLKCISKRYRGYIYKGLVSFSFASSQRWESLTKEGVYWTWEFCTEQFSLRSPAYSRFVFLERPLENIEQPERGMLVCFCCPLRRIEGWIIITEFHWMGAHLQIGSRYTLLKIQHCTVLSDNSIHKIQKHAGLLLFPGGYFHIWQIIAIIVVPVGSANIFTLH